MLPRHPGQTSPLASDHHGLLIIPIHWLASSHCLLSTGKLVCGGRSGALWLPSHHPGGCCTLVVDEEIARLLCKALWVSRKALYKCNKLLFIIIILRSSLAFFHSEGAQARVPQVSGPAVAEAQRRLQSWGSQIDLSAELEMGTALSLPSPDRFSASSQGGEARAAVSSALIEAQTLQLSDPEELDVVSVNARDNEDSPPQSRAYEELVEVLTRAVDWPAEKEDVHSKKKECIFFISTPRCRDRGRNRFPIEFIVHKHLTIPL